MCTSSAKLFQPNNPPDQKKRRQIRNDWPNIQACEKYSHVDGSLEIKVRTFILFWVEVNRIFKQNPHNRYLRLFYSFMLRSTTYSKFYSAKTSCQTFKIQLPLSCRRNSNLRKLIKVSGVHQTFHNIFFILLELLFPSSEVRWRKIGLYPLPPSIWATSGCPCQGHNVNTPWLSWLPRDNDLRVLGKFSASSNGEE